MYSYFSLCLFIKYDTIPTHEFVLSVQKHLESTEQQAPPSESDTQSEVDMTSHQDSQLQVQ